MALKILNKFVENIFIAFLKKIVILKTLVLSFSGGIYE